MKFNDHSILHGSHAFLSGSKYHWINYGDEKLIETYRRFQAIQKGIELHAIAAELIRLRIQLPKSHKSLNRFVNDAIGYRMTPELVLFYSPNAYGTADALSFSRNRLRIHDLKTGETRTSVHQLEVYAAFFCLEYGIEPSEITFSLRIYQSDEILEHLPEPEIIKEIMRKIILFDSFINEVKAEE